MFCCVKKHAPGTDNVRALPETKDQKLNFIKNFQILFSVSKEHKQELKQIDEIQEQAYSTHDSNLIL